MLTDEFRQVDLRIGRVDVGVEAAGLPIVNDVAFPHSRSAREHSAFGDYAFGVKRNGLGRNLNGHFCPRVGEFLLGPGGIIAQFPGGFNAVQAFHVAFEVFDIVVHKRNKWMILCKLQRLESGDQTVVVAIDHRFSVFSTQCRLYAPELLHLRLSHTGDWRTGVFRRGRTGRLRGCRHTDWSGGRDGITRICGRGSCRGGDLVNVSRVDPEVDLRGRFDLVKLEAIHNRTEDLNAVAGLQHLLPGGKLQSSGSSRGPGPLPLLYGALRARGVDFHRRLQHDAVTAHGGLNHQPALVGADNGNLGGTVQDRTVIVVIRPGRIAATRANAN